MKLDEIDELAFRMFKTFARCEYALKAAGIRKGSASRVEADWEKFSEGEEVGRIFDNPENKELVAAIKYFREHPPKKQVVQGGALVWSDAQPDGVGAKLLLLQVNRVRNNLFHGGKFKGNWLEPERSRELLRHSIVILEAAINGHADVKEAYGS